MLRIMIVTAMALLLIGFFLYQLRIYAYAANKGRQVDARVLSCQRKLDEDEEGEAIEYYEAAVAFYGTNGEALVKILKSEKPYTAGDVIRCCYLDRADRLFPGTAHELKADLRHSTVVFIVFFFIFIGSVSAIVWGMPYVQEKPELAMLAFGYFISIMFMAVGVLGVYKKVRLLRNARSMQGLIGVLVDHVEGGRLKIGHQAYFQPRDLCCAQTRRFTEACGIGMGSGRTNSSEGTRKVYFPVYEYDWDGERRCLIGTVGSNKKDERTIGRKVHILVNPQTEETICREDEKAAQRVALILGAIGISIFALAVVFSLRG